VNLKAKPGQTYHPAIIILLFNPVNGMKYTALVLFVNCFIGIAAVSAGALLDAARTGNDRQLDRILKSESGVDIRERGPRGETALHWMAFYGNEVLVWRLLAAGAEINARVEKGGTPLHLAAYSGHAGVAGLLIEHGAKVNARTRAGITPLDWARRNGHSEVALLLIQHGAKVGRAPPGGGGTATQEQRGREQAGIIPPEREGSKGRRKIRMEDLKYKPVQDGTPAEHPVSQASQSASALNEKRGEQGEFRENLQPAASFRIQLAAVSSKQRAADAWALYQRRYPEIVRDLDLMLERVDSKGKRLYRVQAGLLTRLAAQSMCGRLQRRGQPCIVISPGAL
jgi:hypothetical protein